MPEGWVTDPQFKRMQPAPVTDGLIAMTGLAFQPR
jgi:hypothetical protein